MAGVELATGYVSIVPSVKGIASQIDEQLGKPVREAAKKAGEDAGKQLGSSFDKVSGGLTKVGTAATAAAVVAGGALFKVANNFTDLALQANKMSLATGLAVDDASRWIETAGDMGIGAETVEGALGKMNKAADMSPEKFKAIGAEMVRTKDGGLDVQATFLNVVDSLNSITDPAEKQRAAAEILGRGWQGMAELIGEGSGKLKASLDSVNAAKVIDSGELQTAKDFRDSMDALKDSGEQLALSLGKGAAPVIGALASAVGGAVTAFGNLDAISGGMVGKLGTIGAIGLGAVGALSTLAGQTMKLRTRFVELGNDGEKSLTKTGKAAAGVGVAMGLAAAGVALYDLSQMNSERNAKGFTDALDRITRITDDQATKDIPMMVAAWESFNHLKPEEIATKIATENLGAAIRVRDMAVASEELRGKLASQGVTVDMLSTSIGIETEAQKQAAIAAAAAQAATELQTGANNIATGSFERMGLAAGESNIVLAAAEATTLRLNAAFDGLIGRLDNEDAWVGAQKAVDNWIWKMADGVSSTGEQEQAYRDAQRELATYVMGLEGIPETQKTEIITEIEAGHLLSVEQILAALQTPRDVWFNANLNTAPFLAQQAKIGHGYASGTSSAPPGMAWVGEQGPELMRFRGGEQVYTHHDSMQLAQSSSNMLTAALLPRTSGSSGPMVGTVEVHNDVDADGFWRMAHFHMAGV